MTQPSQKLPQAEPQPPPLARTSKKYLNPKRQAYLRKLRANRQKAGQGAVYYTTATQKGLPLVFRTYDGKDLVGIILKDGAVRFTMRHQQGRIVVEKTDLQYTCKASSYTEVQKAVQVDEEVRSQRLEPVLLVQCRYQIPEEDLRVCQQQKGCLLVLTLRGGEVLEGQIEWWGSYDIKLKLATRRSVVIFRHAVYRHEVRGKVG